MIGCEEIWEIILQGYGEGGDWPEELKEHMTECDRCRSEFANMQLSNLN